MDTFCVRVTELITLELGLCYQFLSPQPLKGSHNLNDA